MIADLSIVRWPVSDREEFGRLTQALSRVRDAVDGGGDFASVPPCGPQDASDLDRAQALLAQTVARDAAAGKDADMFANPAWRAMLTLFVADGIGDRIDRGALRAACGSHPAVAGRWLAMLEDRGLMATYADDDDSVGLTEAGRTLVRQCLRAV